jgi:hypothetical protein
MILCMILDEKVMLQLIFLGLHKGISVSATQLETFNIHEKIITYNHKVINIIRIMIERNTT